MAILNPKYNPKARKEKGNNEYFLLATNLPVNSASELST
ncbi:hypothetical protein MNV_1010001 [Candidatus Methanoperedens nitroreducens]|uniref:Uncharacterized protein n=1 Tax=Candidatus Methanoperedens nitratireducens TaxID=1392998 RepID=A0A284VI63_9EURY|nr:hypothetical protein MNV_1010001 [Candidatus Methanoperedens nitroreducens]